MTKTDPFAIPFRLRMKRLILAGRVVRPRQNRPDPRHSRLPNVTLVLLGLAGIAFIGAVAAAGADPGATKDWPVWLQRLTSPASGLAFVVACAIAGGLVWAYWWPRRQERHSVALVAGVVLSITAVALAMPTYARCTGDQAPVWTPLAWTLSLFVGSVENVFTAPPQGCGAPMPLAIQIARLTAIMTTFLGVMAALTTPLRASRDRLLAHLTPSVVLVTGLDDNTIPVIGVLNRQRTLGSRVVVVEADHSHPRLDEVRQMGVLVVVGDPGDPRFLWSLLSRWGIGGRRSVLHAAYVLNDRIDESARVVAALTGVSHISRDDGARPRLIVRFDNPAQANSWRRRQALADTQMLGDTVGINNVTAEAVINTLTASECTGIVIIGTDTLALAVVDELVQHRREKSATAAPSPLRVTVIGEGANDLVADHQGKQRGFPPFNHGVEVVAVESKPDVLTVRALLADSVAPFVIITEPSAPDSDQLVNRLAARIPGIRLLAHSPGTAGVGSTTVVGTALHFGPTLLSTLPGSDAVVISETGWDRIARRMHEDYLAHLGERADPGKPNTRPWEELSDFYRESGVRRVGAALEIASRAGRVWHRPKIGTPVAAPLRPEEIERFAELEHQSWCDYYVAHGWAPGERREKRWRTLRHPSLVPWEELDDYSRRYVVESVGEALDSLATIGFVPMNMYFRRRGEVVARQRAEGWTWTTRTGAAMTAAAGDWEVHETDGGPSWSVADEAFQRTYEHVSGETYRRTGVVTARPGNPGETVMSTEGRLDVSEEQWVVTDSAGKSWVVDDQHFTDSYESCPPEDLPPVR
ncbi:hypothetical protein GOARA_013_00080 [Gordonia araii NBRC 100433]|uniref:Ryanodine receptor Ryr domain-containing protein n=1 Tax=Gordonia araii NBRC 100433 TaxID=1073574 RepID=G7GY89_9ACTN|nr:RyR domain-containing protein [Gordonia araii]NNG97438.1 hypothetical protein [Gordonia araii NBRC 100433]GAB08564.1 hypothetical protein GOARA_013_00080 [Gordonia araii NBRC 100433]